MPTIKEIREQYLISRQRLAALADVGMSTLDRVENHNHRVKPEVAKRIVDALSSETGQQFTLENVTGLNLYNAMRDHGRKKEEVQP